MKKYIIIINFFYCLFAKAQNDSINLGVYNLPNINIASVIESNKSKSSKAENINLGDKLNPNISIKSFNKSVFESKVEYSLDINNCSRYCRYSFNFTYYENVNPNDSVYLIDEKDSIFSKSINKSINKMNGFHTQISLPNNAKLRLKIVLYGFGNADIILNEILILFPYTSLNPDPIPLEMHKTNTSPPFGNSLSCQKDVKCLTGFDNEIKSVFLIASDRMKKEYNSQTGNTTYYDGSGNTCASPTWVFQGLGTGALINNDPIPSKKRKPFVLTANHLRTLSVEQEYLPGSQVYFIETTIEARTPDNWYFYYGVQNTTCGVTNTNSFANDYFTGSDVTFGDVSQDILLVQLYNNVDEDAVQQADMCYAGWDSRPQILTPSSIINDPQIFIGHPKGDVKKRTILDPNSLVLASNANGRPTYISTGLLPNNGYLEGGQSGSPSFSIQNKIIATVIRGSKLTDCLNPNTMQTELTSFEYNYNHFTIIKNNLNPNSNTQLTFMDTYCPLPPAGPGNGSINNPYGNTIAYNSNNNLGIQLTSSSTNPIVDNGTCRQFFDDFSNNNSNNWWAKNINGYSGNPYGVSSPGYTGLWAINLKGSFQDGLGSSVPLNVSNTNMSYFGTAFYLKLKDNKSFSSQKTYTISFYAKPNTVNPFPGVNYTLNSILFMNISNENYLNGSSVTPIFKPVTYNNDNVFLGNIQIKNSGAWNYYEIKFKPPLRNNPLNSLVFYVDWGGSLNTLPLPQGVYAEGNILIDDIAICSDCSSTIQDINYTQNSTIPSSTYAGNSIVATNTIISNNTYFESGNHIYLEPGFETVSNIDFTAEITPCYTNNNSQIKFTDLSASNTNGPRGSSLNKTISGIIPNYQPNSKNIVIYPNPAKDLLNIEFPNIIIGNKHIVIYNNLFQKVKEIDLHNDDLINSFSIVDLTTGIYYIDMSFADNNKYYSKLLKD